MTQFIAGYPVGALLLYGPLANKALGKTSYQLIDGLQRSYALKEYQGSPLAFHRYLDLPEAIRTPFEESLAAAASLANLTDGFASAMNGWLSSTKTPDVESGFDPYKMLTFLEGSLVECGELARQR